MGNFRREFIVTNQPVCADSHIELPTDFRSGRKVADKVSDCIISVLILSASEHVE